MEQKSTPNKWECFLLNGGQYRICLPVVLLTQTACRPGSRFLPCAQRNSSVRKQKQRCAFQILPQAKQFARLLPMEQKSTPNKWECFLLNGGQYRICLPVVLLTQTACRPGSRFLPCAQRNSSVRKQKQRCAFQILPQAKQFARLLPMEQKSTPNKWECFLLNGGQYRI